LAFVLIVALAVRLVAVIYSRGFIQSDDYYDTVEVSYDWLRNGLRDESGCLHWKEQPATTIVRFPLYTLFLYVVMKLHYIVGITALDRMMYGIRLLHALISLLPIWAVFRLTQRITGKNNWAVFGGLAVALHFAMPFLGVRNLIEMVGGNIWIVAIYYFYRHQEDKQTKWLYLAGLMTGLAWMIRFQLAFAVLPIPLILWYERRSIKPAFHYCMAVFIMLVISAAADKLLLGYFAASTINNLTLNTGLGARYTTIPFMYPLLMLGFFIPPLSVLLMYLGCRLSFIRRHGLLIASSLCFVVCHMIHPNQQERFMIPIVPVLFLIAILALYHQYQRKGYILKSRKAFAVITIVTLVVNFILLPPLTFGYGHRGLIEPLISFERMNPRPKVMFIQPGMHRWIPEAYAGFEPLPRVYIRAWDDLNRLPPQDRRKDAFDYFLLYPLHEQDLQAYLDSIQTRYGLLEKVKCIKPSTYDMIFHELNPNHYRTYEAFVYKPKGI